MTIAERFRLHGRIEAVERENSELRNALYDDDGLRDELARLVAQNADLKRRVAEEEMEAHA